MTDLPDRYDPSAVEPRWYAEWERAGYFRADVDSPKQPYTIVMPPPNVTGSLHMGHALGLTIQDVLTRYHRMAGWNALWVPGTDHAGIATQVVVERQVAAEGMTKEELGREAFLARVWKWVEESSGTIKSQLRRLGASCDWGRERFTLDPGLTAAVREEFVRLYEEGLLYRDDRLINWCPRCQTVLSDLEVDREERDGEFVYIKYGPLTLGTVRPETKLGDTGLAVHPKDRRYRKYVGQTLTIPSVQGDIEIKVVADEAVDPKFGTGVIKVTPGHDPVDFEIGRRHGLPVRSVIGFDGKMTALAGTYAGMDRFECRRQIVADMQALGLIERIEPYRHAVGLCYRCKTVVEPLVSRQWFMNMQSMAEMAVKAVRSRRMRIVPRAWTKTYFHWMENIRPWCVSRQLWWGHRIPAWYCDADGSVHVARQDLTACPQCGGALRQDPDVLDTWFSSGLWPFSTLGWPQETADLKTFYPTSVLVTGYDIIFFWVARMAMLGLKFMGDVPFRDVFLHTIVRDPEGQKMSKTKGNVVDPLLFMEQYGTDAFRFTLAALSVPGVRDIRIAEERVEGSRNFANKVWNAARFVLANLDGYDPRLARKSAPSVADRWIRSRLAATARTVRASLDRYRFNDAASAVYQFLWHEFCDWYLEIAKRSLYQTEDRAARARTQKTLVETLETTLRLLHPFMPFITEEIWQKLPHEGPSIMIAPFPKAGRGATDTAAEAEMDVAVALASAIRTVRSESRVPPAAEVAVTVRPPAAAAGYEAAAPLVGALTRARVSVVPGAERPPRSALAVAAGAEVYVHMEGAVDLAAERARLTREIERAQKEIAFLQGKLARPEFVERAPADVVARERSRLVEQEAVRATLAASLAALA